MSIDIKLSEAQISKMIQSAGFFCNMLGILGKKVIANLEFSLSGNNLPGLISNLTSNAINKFGKK